jgi:Ribulose bisphosphate carboxylase, small chain
VLRSCVGYADAVRSTANMRGHVIGGAVPRSGTPGGACPERGQLPPSLNAAVLQLVLTSDSNMQGYYDNRYWTMWKLPMFGCNDPNQVLQETTACKRAFPECYIRLVAFDNIAQCQTIGFLVNRPSRASEFKKPQNRSV